MDINLISMLFNTFLTTCYSDTTFSRYSLQGQLGSSSVKGVGGDRLCKRKIPHSLLLLYSLLFLVCLYFLSHSLASFSGPSLLGSFHTMSYDALSQKSLANITFIFFQDLIESPRRQSFQPYIKIKSLYKPFIFLLKDFLVKCMCVPWFVYLVCVQMPRGRQIPWSWSLSWRGCHDQPEVGAETRTQVLGRVASALNHWAINPWYHILTNQMHTALIIVYCIIIGTIDCRGLDWCCLNSNAKFWLLKTWLSLTSSSSHIPSGAIQPCSLT